MSGFRHDLTPTVELKRRLRQLEAVPMLAHKTTAEHESILRELSAREAALRDEEDK